MQIKLRTCTILPFLLSTLVLQGCAAVIVGSAATGAIMTAQDRRTTGTMVEDKSIQLKAIQEIQTIANDDPNIHVSAICYNGHVLLIGQVPSRSIRADIESAIRNIAKVEQLHNEIILKEPSTVLQRSTDSWITAKIKSQIAVTKDMNPTRVKVTTEDGIVYLMGIVQPLEEEITVDIARHTKGVKKVVKIFEYA
ncbi:MAG: BON domain-containing protein [Proteobacteria bacterium]|nr:BON domain-containing protein [Pseudomonadota bacterium]